MKKAVIYLTASTFIGAGLAFLTQVLLARALSPAGFGAFSAAYSIVMMLSPIAGFGIGSLWLKFFGEEGWQGLRWVKPSLHFTVISTLFTMFLVWGWALLGPNDGLNRNLLIILSFFIIGTLFLTLGSSVYQLEEKFTAFAFWQFLPNALRFVLVGLWVFFSSSTLDAVSAAIIFSVTSLVVAIVGIKLIVRLNAGHINLKGHGDFAALVKKSVQPSFFEVLNEAWPFGIAGVFYLIYFQSSIVLVQYFLGDVQAGKYSVAITVMTAIYLFPSLIYNKLLLPKIHRWATHDVKKLRETYKKGNIYMFSFGVLLVLCCYIAIPILVSRVFGEAYADAAAILLIMIFAVPLRFLATSVGAILVTKNNMRKKVIYMGGTALCSLVTASCLIPMLGLVGAASSAVISEAFQLAVYYKAVNKIWKEQNV